MTRRDIVDNEEELTLLKCEEIKRILMFFGAVFMVFTAWDHRK